jgi:hypothetical protein
MVTLPQCFAPDITKTGDWGSNARRKSPDQTHDAQPEAEGGKRRIERAADYT